VTARRQPQPDAQTALAQRREAGGADSNRRDLVKEIERLQPEFQRAMPRGREAVQLVRDAITCLRTVRNLAECQPESVFGALMTCAQLGLRPNVPALGAAYLVPFRNHRQGGALQAQLIVGYQGYIDLAMRSDRLDGVIARTVREGDLFDVDYGLADTLVHKPARFRPGHVEDLEREPAATDYYAIVKYRGGGHAFWTMSHAQVERHRRRYSKTPDRGPWVDNFDEMGQKTCVRLVAKFMPKSTEFDALARGMQVDEGVRVNFSAGADPTEVTESTFSGQVVDGDIVDDPAGQDGPPPVEGWPAVTPPADAS
jgi:recombination protein RecT